MNIIQELYDSEINASISWNWDAGYDVKLGDGTYSEDGNWEAVGHVDGTFKDVEDWFIAKSLIFYPKSDFSKKYRNRDL